MNPQVTSIETENDQPLKAREKGAAMANRCKWKQSAMIWWFSPLLLVGCHSTPPSEIVRQVEIEDSGDVKQVPVESLMNFFDHHARLAVRVEALCAPKRSVGDATWKISDEGKVCQAVASRDRVQYLQALEAMKRMDTKDGDQGAAANIEKAEGK